MTTTEETKVAVMQKEISYISKQVDTIVDKLDNNYVTKEEHENLKTKVIKIEDIINKLVWIIVSAVLTALLASVIIYTK